ncbi:MAG TPA: type III polyketide synthase [Candidatus Bathyarchaeia archaeon]|nr:type III polyketide synthase [Candidatus Bathyarchaeia archaeon]
MSAPKIAAVATATPPWRYDQATVLRMSGYDDPRRMGFFSNSLIETRHLYFDPATFTKDETVDQLNDRWRRGAIEVGKTAVARAIERAGWRREDVDFLATTTCTGRVCPSLDAQIISELGLKPTVQRVHVGDTGCASAMVAMQQAANHLRAFPGHRAVMVAVEICSAAYFLDDRLESAVAHAIFADGAGAIALGTEADGPEIVEHRTLFRSEHLGAMGFEYPGGRPRVVLSKDVRRIGAGMMAEMAQALMAGQGLKKDDVSHFVLHSAGRRVIEQVGKLMELDETQLAHSRRVLQEYGNMSSATVVFVLDDLLRSRETVPGDWGLMIALGPGFAAEGALLRW